MINFSSFLVTFLFNWVDFSEKVDFYIKNRVFLVFFDIKFKWFLINFVSFFDPFLGFLGGYPSPSISAPLVVKKCPKLYIYNIGVACPSHPWPPMIPVMPKAPMVKWQNSIGQKNTKGRTRIDEKSNLWISPTTEKKRKTKIKKNRFGLERGERE